jgi:hypothetical protein
MNKSASSSAITPARGPQTIDAQVIDITPSTQSIIY